MFLDILSGFVLLLSIACDLWFYSENDLMTVVLSA